MCDNDSLDDMMKYPLRSPDVSRRELGKLALGTGVAMMLLPRLANAADVKESEVDIKTPDGTADAYFVHPSSGPAPAVLIWPDIFGLRPAFRQMGKRLAESGYAVLVINPFYRSQRAPTAPSSDFADPATRAALGALTSKLSPETAKIDAVAFVSWLDTQDAVDKKRKIGTMGYCLGGPFTMRTAAELPDRIGAAASFHGGGLVNDTPNSPHLLVPKMKASYLFAIAKNDDERQPTAKDTLREAFAKANLAAEIEVYPAMHGWCPPDSRVYDEAQAEKAWGRLLALFKTGLA